VQADSRHAQFDRGGSAEALGCDHRQRLSDVARYEPDWRTYRSDLVSEGLRIDESALNGQATIRRKKTRIASIPASLRAEL
jgi:hypothetical protein